MRFDKAVGREMRFRLIAMATGHLLKPVAPFLSERLVVGLVLLAKASEQRAGRAIVLFLDVFADQAVRDIAQALANGR